jgi:hypothetical protein
MFPTRHGSTPLGNQSPVHDDAYDEIPKCMCVNFSSILPPTKCSSSLQSWPGWQTNFQDATQKPEWS